MIPLLLFVESIKINNNSLRNLFLIQTENESLRSSCLHTNALMMLSQISWLRTRQSRKMTTFIRSLRDRHMSCVFLLNHFWLPLFTPRDQMKWNGELKEEGKSRNKFHSAIIPNIYFFSAHLKIQFAGNLLFRKTVKNWCKREKVKKHIEPSLRWVRVGIKFGRGNYWKLSK